MSQLFFVDISDLSKTLVKKHLNDEYERKNSGFQVLKTNSRNMRVGEGGVTKLTVGNRG